jgi:hypothetical protein
MKRENMRKGREGVGAEKTFYGAWATSCLSLLKPHFIADFNSRKKINNLGSVLP